MPPPNPWTDKNQQTTKVSDRSFPGLKSNTQNAIPANQYQEAQEDELIVLSAMYGDEFHNTRPESGAWKRSEPTFTINIKSSDEQYSVMLHVRFTATYPRTLPLLTLEGDEDLRDRPRYKIRQIVHEKPTEMLVLEQAMIVEIVEAIREVLEEAALAKTAGLELSLEEERTLHEAEVARLAQKQKDEKERKRQQEDIEEERLLGHMVEDELKRQRTKAKEARLKTKSQSQDVPQIIHGGDFQPQLIFENAITADDSDGNPIAFRAIAAKHLIRRGPTSDCFTVLPIIPPGSSQPPIVVLKQTDLRCESNEQSSFKKAMQALETELDILKKVRHHNILRVLDFEIRKATEVVTHSLWTASILCEYGNKGSLEELLELAGTLGVEKSRAWTIELLDALRFLHESGIVHAALHASNILLVRSSTGEVTAKIGDAGFQTKLRMLSNSKRAVNTISVAKSAYWSPPELASRKGTQFTQKTDIWNFGIVFMQMIFGLDVLQKYVSPAGLVDALLLSDSLNEFVTKLFKADPKRRPRAFELSSCEFLATDAPILVEASSRSHSRIRSMDSFVPPTAQRLRRESSHIGASSSRYKEDFVEESRLGVGGFGEVVKARKKLDGQLYAIKKITQKSTSLTEILKEIRVLSQLSHPYVVRYFSSWTETEEIKNLQDTDEDTITTEESESALSPMDGGQEEFDASTGGLDFISSSRVPFEFAYDTEEDDSQDEDETSGDDSSSEQITSPEQKCINIDMSAPLKNKGLELKRTRSDTQSQANRTRTTLYISMQYCEKRTLRDLIKRELFKDDNEIWRLFRQTLEGLAHVHGMNVVHRDLKPENIFIDGQLDCRIGDFGLATSGQYTMPEKGVSQLSSHQHSEMTASIGTPYYVAPEVRSSVNGGYNSKVDMYSLGVILFEMCYPSIVGMERSDVLGKLRDRHPTLPSEFDLKTKAAQADIILSLLNHNPKERPSSSELLQSRKLPLQMESETIRQTLAGLSSSTSPYYQKMMTALFSRPRDSISEAKDFAYDISQMPRSTSDLLLQGLVKQKLTSIFRHHGAIESPRATLIPRSESYGPDAVQLLEPNGTLVQLPYDLTLPHARMLAKNSPSATRTFAFGNVFRDRHDGAQPQTFGEVDFDIVTTSALDLALKEAEVIKVLDEIVVGFPSMTSNQMCFHINHSDLLNLIFDFCQIEKSVREPVAEVLSKLNIQQWTWQKIRNELRSPLIGLSTMSLDDLQRFDFRDTPTKAISKLKKIFEGSNIFEGASSTIAHLKDVVTYLKLMKVTCKIFINPLSSLKERFYRGGVLFQVLYDGRSRDVFAAGGRYDSLIRQHRHRSGNQPDERHAVGFSLAWEKLSSSMARFQKGSKQFLRKMQEELSGIWNTRRCDVLVASFDASILRSTGIELVQLLWANEVSAELAADARSPEELNSKHREDHHSWIVIIKQDMQLKVKSTNRKDSQDIDINITQLISWLRSEFREREHREAALDRTARTSRLVSQSEAHSLTESTQDVRVLISSTKFKKSNRQSIRQQAQARVAALVGSFLYGPIAVIESTDQVVDQIRGTRLSDPETWRKVSQSVSTADRRYIGEIHDLLTTLAHENRDTTNNAFVYNFRTGACIYYDLGA